MRKILSLSITAVFLIFQIRDVNAEIFTFGATVPIASSVTIQAYKVLAGTGVPGTKQPTDIAIPATGALNFESLTYHPEGSINAYFASTYYMLNIVPNGAGNTNTTVSYTEGAMPAGQTNGGLGVHATATFVKVTGTDEVPIAPTASIKKALNTINVRFEPRTSFIDRFPFIATSALTSAFSTKPKKDLSDEHILGQMRLLFSDQKAEIVTAIRENKPQSIYALAKVVKRDFKAVRQDLSLLEQFGIIRLVSGTSLGKTKGKQILRKTLKPIITAEKLVINLEI